MKVQIRTNGDRLIGAEEVNVALLLNPPAVPSVGEYIIPAPGWASCLVLEVHHDIAAVNGDPDIIVVIGPDGTGELAELAEGRLKP